MGLSQEKSVITTPSGGGVDTLHVALYLDWDAQKFVDIVEELDICKRKSASLDDPAFVEFGGVTFEVLPRGRGKNFSYVLKGADFTLLLTSKDSASGTRCNGFAELGSAFLMEEGDVRAWLSVVRCLSRAGADLIEDRVSRVDACVDVSGVIVGDFVSLFNAKKMACRAVEVNPYYKNYRATGLELGGKTAVVKCRIYDKIQELKDKPDCRKAKAVADRLGGTMPESLTRCEFQLRKESLREYGVISVDEWFDRAEGIVRNLSNDWLRFLDPPETFDRRKLKSYATASAWSVVQDAFADAYDSTTKIVKRVRKKVAGCVTSLAQQALGCLKTVAAEFEATEPWQVLDYGIREMKRVLGMQTDLEVKKDLAKRIMRKDQADHENLARKVHTEFLHLAPDDYLERLRADQHGRLMIS